MLTIAKGDFLPKGIRGPQAGRKSGGAGCAVTREGRAQALQVPAIFWFHLCSTWPGDFIKKQLQFLGKPQGRSLSYQPSD